MRTADGEGLDSFFKDRPRVLSSDRIVGRMLRLIADVRTESTAHMVHNALIPIVTVSRRASRPCLGASPRGIACRESASERGGREGARRRREERSSPRLPFFTRFFDYFDRFPRCARREPPQKGGRSST